MKASAEQLQRRVAQWLAAELQRCEQAHGVHWPLHRDWILEYLTTEARERLAAWRNT